MMLSVHNSTCSPHAHWLLYRCNLTIAILLDSRQEVYIQYMEGILFLSSAPQGFLFKNYKKLKDDLVEQKYKLIIVLLTLIIDLLGSVQFEHFLRKFLHIDYYVKVKHTKTLVYSIHFTSQTQRNN